jgi:hypothetical protein
MVLYVGSQVRLQNGFTLNGVYTDPTTVTIKTTSPAGTELTTTFPAAGLTADAVGRYSYVFTPGVVGVWSYLWTGTGTVESTSAGSFTVYAAGTLVPDPTTLMAIEQEVARRCHADFLVTGVSATLTSSQTLVGLDRIRSTANIGGYEGLWVLRRGRTVDGAAVSGFDQNDRVRYADIYDADSGQIQVDRAYATAPVAGEEVEIHLLHPDEQLRPAVLAGLRRCYFMDRRTVTLVGAAAERDLTTSLPWLTEPWQVKRISSRLGANSFVSTERLPFSRFINQGGHLYMDADAFDPFPGTLYVEALRPAISFVNGSDSATGPTDDNDEVPVPLDYAAAAGHAEAWRRAKTVLLEPAQTGKAVSQKEASDEFTRQSLWVRRAVPRRESMASPYLPDLMASGYLA